MKKISRIALTIVLLLAALAAAFQFGRSKGFKTGSEWALVQAEIVAQEAGVFMPVYMKDGKFRVVIKQPHGIYKKAWQQADQQEEAREIPRTTKLEKAEHPHANSDI